jgi:exodeoxyribonuclease-3
LIERKEEIKLLQFNILEGCINDETRLKRIGNFLRSNNYDIVGLNEAPITIGQIGREWGYQHSQIAVAEGREYYVAILSKYPIHLLDMYNTLFHHGMIHAKILDNHFIVTHLDPGDSLLRENEALLIKNIIMRINEPLMVMGDLNNLSPLDSKGHEENNIRKILQSTELLRKKFLDLEGDINYRPIEYLLETGLTDLLDKWNANTYTVPTEYNKDSAHAVRMRLDYVLVKKFFGHNFRVRVIQNKVTNSLSDHYPLECVWNTT